MHRQQGQGRQQGLKELVGKVQAKVEQDSGLARAAAVIQIRC
jgi:hypothetical protein